MGARAYSAVLLPDGRTLAVSGEIDEFSVDDFRSAVTECIESSDDPVVDLSDVEFLPSRAVGALIGVLKRGDPITIVARSNCLAAKVLGICGIPFQEPAERSA